MTEKKKPTPTPRPPPQKLTFWWAHHQGPWVNDHKEDLGDSFQPNPPSLTGLLRECKLQSQSSRERKGWREETRESRWRVSPRERWKSGEVAKIERRDEWRSGKRKQEKWKKSTKKWDVRKKNLKSQMVLKRSAGRRMASCQLDFLPGGQKPCHASVPLAAGSRPGWVSHRDPVVWGWGGGHALETWVYVHESLGF